MKEIRSNQWGTKRQFVMFTISMERTGPARAIGMQRAVIGLLRKNTRDRQENERKYNFS